MTVTIVPMYDTTGADEPHLPPGQAAGYDTGTGIVPWTTAQFGAHPGAVHIAQSPAESIDDPPHSDVLDVENGAATPADCPGWYRSALAAYNAGTRPGQRYPAVYVNLSNVTAVANEFIAAGITSGPRLWIANWNLTEPEAAALVVTAGGPWPVIGVQYEDNGTFDTSAMSKDWLDAVSGPAPPPHPPAGWAYPAPASLGGSVSRAVTLKWPAVVPSSGHPAPGSYTVLLELAGKPVKQVSVLAGLSTTITGLAPGSYEAMVWANGGPDAPPHASFSFTA